MSRIYGWFMNDVPHRGMAIARILLGFCFLGAYVVRIPYAQFLYGPHGFSGVEVYDKIGEKFGVSVGLGKLLVLYPSDSAFMFLYGLLLFSAFCFMIGYKSRFFGILLAVLHVTMDQRNYFATAGWSKLAHCFAIYVAMSRGGDIWSLDSYLRGRKGATIDPSLPAPAWPIRLLQIHVCTMYFVSSFSRLWQEVWTKGYALIFTYQHFEYSRWNFNTSFWDWPLHGLDWAALAVEPFAFAGLWLPVLGPIWAVALAAMHVALEISTHVDWWNFMMIAGLTSFIPASWLTARKADA